MNFRLTTLACTAFLIGMAGAAAQQLSVVEESATSEEEAVLHSWTARVDQDISYCMKTYSDFIKSLVDTKVSKRSKSVLAADKTVIPELSPLRIDQRAIFTSESAGTAVAFTFSPGYDVHFGGDSYAKEFAVRGHFFRLFPIAESIGPLVNDFVLPGNQGHCPGYHCRINSLLNMRLDLVYFFLVQAIFQRLRALKNSFNVLGIGTGSTGK
jgi:hypothetical protein